MHAENFSLLSTKFKRDRHFKCCWHGIIIKQLPKTDLNISHNKSEHTSSRVTVSAQQTTDCQIQTQGKKESSLKKILDLKDGIWLVWESIIHLQLEGGEF